jgi:hypothetical protein
MRLDEKLRALVSLGNYLRAEIHKEPLQSELQKAYALNPWFTVVNSEKALQAIADNFLTEKALSAVNEKYALHEISSSNIIGLVLAGNIPAVGFHDILCVFLTNNKAQIKLSSKDSIIIRFLIKQLQKINGHTSEYFEFVDRIQNYDAVLATGGNNTSRYFEYYFKKVPHVIRKSRSSVGVVQDKISNQDIEELGSDVLSYFGLGCRNVSKIMVPEGYDVRNILKVWDLYEDINNHNKYRNNFDYSLALYLLNREEVLANNCVILRENSDVASRISCVHYEYYFDHEDLFEKMNAKRDDIQCIVGNTELNGFELFEFGQAQFPGIFDYADGVDTIQFLMNING